jgi:hypothetical protein
MWSHVIYIYNIKYNIYIYRYLILSDMWSCDDPSVWKMLPYGTWLWKIPSALGRSTCHSALRITCPWDFSKKTWRETWKTNCLKKFLMVFCHRVESCHCTQDDKSEHPSLKETSVQRPSQRSPAQTTAQAHTAHTKLQGLSARVLLRFFPLSKSPRVASSNTHAGLSLENY